MGRGLEFFILYNCTMSNQFLKQINSIWWTEIEEELSYAFKGSVGLLNVLLKVFLEGRTGKVTVSNMQNI